MDGQMIWTPERELLFRIGKYRDRSIVLPRATFGVGGEFMLDALKDDGRVRPLTPWFHNNVPNAGMDMFATNGSRYLSCQVGSGNTAPSNSDTTLQTFVAGTSTRNYIQTINSGSPLYYSETYFRYDYATGAISGNLNEVGVGPSATSGTTLFSRELTRDSGGSPATVTVLSTESLRVHYKIRHYPPVTNQNGTVNGTIAGSPASRTYASRGFNVGNTSIWGPSGSGTAGVFSGSLSASSCACATGTGQVITASSLNGTSFNSTSVSYGSYTNGVFSRAITAAWNTTTANANILSFVFRPNINLQFDVDTAFPKSNVDTLTMEAILAWARYP